MNIKIFFIAGVEGCGHHALTPAIHASLSQHMNRQENRIHINQASIVLLNQACCELWYLNHKTVQDRQLARNRITSIMHKLQAEAESSGETQILILDNSFPSSRFRTVETQWNLEELVELTAPFAEIHFLGLYRDPIATTFSHREWDGGLRGHAMIIATFLEYLQDKLCKLNEYNLKIVHYEDLVGRTSELVVPLACYLDVDPVDAETGLGDIRKSDKDWRRDMQEDDRTWITSFFNTERISRWSVFHDRSLNLLP